MPKKKPSELKAMTEAHKKTKKEPKPAPNPKGGNPPVASRFVKGQSGNPSGRPPDSIAYFRKLQERMMLGQPPRELCEELEIDPELTWGEAIAEAIFRAAMRGDVAAAREAMAVLAGAAGSARSNVNVLVQQAGETTLSYEFLRHAHGLSPEQLATVWAFMDALPRRKPEIDASYFPDDSYREQPKQLTEGIRQEEESE